MADLYDRVSSDAAAGLLAKEVEYIVLYLFGHETETLTKTFADKATAR